MSDKQNKHEGEPMETTKARHRKHQTMLTQHSLQKEASTKRSHQGTIKQHKEDSEMFGFKTLIVPKV